MSHISTAEVLNSKSVAPLIEFLRQNDALQSEMERRLAELRSLNECAT